MKYYIFRVQFTHSEAGKCVFPYTDKMETAHTGSVVGSMHTWNIQLDPAPCNTLKRSFILIVI